jgi:hypothetical protein
MDEKAFQRKMADLIERIRDLPVKTPVRPDRSKTNGPETTQNTLRLSVEELQESLDYLRLSVKYLVFDLEATRRENAYLRRLVEQANKERDHGNTDES